VSCNFLTMSDISAPLDHFLQPAGHGYDDQVLLTEPRQGPAYTSAKQKVSSEDNVFLDTEHLEGLLEPMQLTSAVYLEE
jgi:hypothetical protein